MLQSFSIDVLKSVLMLLSMQVAAGEAMDAAHAQMQSLLYLSMQMCGAMAGLTSMHEYRRICGIDRVYNKGQLETSLTMMEEHPYQFYELYRMTPNTFWVLYEKLWEHVNGSDEYRVQCPRRGRSPSREVFRNRLLYTLSFLSSACSFRQLSQTWGKSLDWGELLIEELASMKDKIVRWPDPCGPKMLQTCLGFQQMRGLKGCCGCIDGSFIKIPAPYTQHNNPGDFNTYKKYYAIQLLAVCNANKIFTYVHTGTPGSRADAWILRQTNLYKYPNQYFPKARSFNNYTKDYYLLADSGFPLLPWVIKAYSKKQEMDAPVEGGLRRRRRLFSADQKSTRACIEHAFGILKKRWPCLHNGLRCPLRHANKTLMACIVLHNICIAEGDVWNDYDKTKDKDPDEGVDKVPDWLVVKKSLQQVPGPQRGDKTQENAGAQVRSRLTDKWRANRRPPPRQP